jgi:DedD protein
MNWAFWRRRKPRATRPGRTEVQQGDTAASEELAVDPAGVRIGTAARIRIRMRRRLIGAAALLLGTAVVVPMMLDPTPRPLPDNIPIDIPSERTPFAPKLSLPATAPSAEAPGATAGKPSEARSPAEASNAKEGAPETIDEAPTSAAEAGGAKAGSAKEGAKAGQWFVQAAALSNENAARQLSEKLTKAGMTPFVERTENAGTVLYRVRLGPFASRDAAVKARRRLHALAVGSNVVRVEQTER